MDPNGYTEQLKRMDILAICGILGKLKHLKRTGWVQHQVPEPETVASHMYRMAMLAQLLPPPIDHGRCIKMALAHDMGEAIVGDLTPSCGIGEAEKFDREMKAMNEIALLVPGAIGSEWRELWLEYEAGATAEALAVKQLDKLDMIVQAFEYEQAQAQVGLNLEQFFTGTEGYFKTEPFLQWDKQLREKRKVFWAGKSMV